MPEHGDLLYPLTPWDMNNCDLVTSMVFDIFSKELKFTIYSIIIFAFYNQ